jgi:hypothetical protein
MIFNKFSFIHYKLLIFAEKSNRVILKIAVKWSLFLVNQDYFVDGVLSVAAVL